MGQRSILVIEDHRFSRKIYTCYLEHAGYQVVAVATAREAFEQLSTSCPHAIVLGLCLPRPGELALARLLKRDPRTAGLPLVVVTVSDQLWDVHATGADGLILIPGGLRGLAGEVRRLIAGTTPLPKESSKIGPENTP